MFCPQCGAPNEEESVFCGNCGAVLDPEHMPAGAEVEESLPGELPPEAPAPPPARVPPPPPPRPGAVSHSAPTSGMAIAALILGIGGLTVLPLLGSFLALIFGYMARSEIRRNPHDLTGEGLAVAGIVLGWLSIALTVLAALLVGGVVFCGLCGAVGAGSY